jgi:hypothetical protein
LTQDGLLGVKVTVDFKGPATGRIEVFYTSSEAVQAPNKLGF